MKTKTTPQTIENLNNQIKALNKLILEGNTKNVYVLQNKIRSLKNRLKTEITNNKEQLNIIAENNYWEKYTSI
jgi:predicted RNase H-like nuclease (RuvC/YqgF family)